MAEKVLKCKGIVTKIIFNDNCCKVILQTEQQYKSIEKDGGNNFKTKNLFEVIENEKQDIECLESRQEFIIKGSICHCIELNKKYILTLKEKVKNTNEYEITEIEICQN